MGFSEFWGEMWCHRESQSPACALCPCSSSPYPAPEILVLSYKLCPLQTGTTCSLFRSRVLMWSRERGAIPSLRRTALGNRPIQFMEAAQTHLAKILGSRLCRMWSNRLQKESPCCQWAYPLVSAGLLPIGKRYS